MDPCIFPLPQVKDVHDISGGALEKWPKRLNAASPRITSKIIYGITVRTLNEDVQLWRRRVSHYGIILKSLNNCKFRNVMDMNAGFGGFAAALTKFPVWVMNVVPFDAKNNTLGIIYERGLYQDQDHSSCDQSKQREQASTDVAEDQEAVSEALVV
ncbi:hypothetical protein ACB092_04G036000 [Castanea dentata]